MTKPPRKRGANSLGLPSPVQSATPRSAPSAALPFAVVGIGASAGGLEAFTQLLEGLAPDTGMAFVLVSHLSPSHSSLLAPILARATRLPVEEVTGEPAIEPNHVYVIPPGKEMSVAGGHLRLRSRPADHEQHRPIDRFLQSLAEEQGHRSMAVILSGTANDGTLGVEEVKGAGGITFAQDGTAQYDGMPESAIATGCIDMVLPPDAIAREIVRLARHPLLDSAADADAPPIDEASLVGLLGRVYRETGVDFSHYKRNTLQRRIMRRMVLRKVLRIEDYRELLERDAQEVAALYQDILINVTSFFRNPDAFAALQTDVFPKLVERDDGHPVRMWVMGCSTGEEAYSLAIAFTEFAAHLPRPVTLQIFATDINNAALSSARSGTYSSRIAENVSPERLRRFFVPMAGGYQVAKSIRDMCIFARHNGLADPPFSRIDLVSCRHLLIYFEPVLQRQVLPLLHYALRPGGYLWLGSSETIGSHRDLFELQEVKHKIYLRKPGRTRPSPRMTRGDIRLGSVVPPAPPAAANPSDVQREFDRALLQQYAPPSVLIDGAFEILQFRGDTGAFFSPTPGKASLNLLKMLREGLLTPTRVAVGRAKESGRTVREEGLRVTLDGASRDISVEVVPVRIEGQPELFLVAFELAPLPEEPPGPATAEAPPRGGTPERLRQEADRLKRELLHTEQQLQAVIEQQEAANADLQSANEEIHSANEELQSINEELETSKEEIQSSNEELTTLNDELHSRNIELAQSNNDVLNLISSAEMAMVMFDRDLRIRRFTPTAERVLSLIPADIGRPIGDLNFRLEIADLEALLRNVIATAAPVVREAQDRQGRWHQVRIRPYLTADRVVEGAVLVAIDIDSLKHAEAAALADEARLRIMQEQAPIGICESDRQGRILRVNAWFCHILGYTQSELVQMRLTDIIHRDDVDAVARAVARVWTGESTSYRVEKRYLRRGGEFIWAEVHGYAIRTADGEAQSKVVLVQDISDRRLAEIALRESESRFRLLIDSTPVLIWVSGQDGCQFVNRAFLEFAGVPESALLGTGWTDYVHPADRDAFVEAYAGATGRGDPFRSIVRVLRSDGHYRWMLAIARPRMSMTVGVVGSMYDITDLKEAEDALRRADHRKDEFLALLAHELRAPLAPLHNVVELLRTTGLDDATFMWARDVLGRQVLNLARMVDDLLDVSRVAHGKIVLRQERVDLTVLLVRTVEMVQHAIDDCQQTLKVTLPAEPVWLVGDSVRLEQVFGNLLRNASKFTPKGGELALSLSVHPADAIGGAELPVAEVRIRDNGDGIDAAMLETIFDPFVQADRSVNRTRGGLGIGLTLVRKLLELHHGTVTAHSEGLGRGSEFVVRLPIRSLSDVEDAPTETDGDLPDISRRILLVDDSVDASEALAALLRHLGHEVALGHDGRTAHALAEQFRPDIALLDIGLPGATGFDVARQIRQSANLAGVVLVALTGYGSHEDRALGREAGFDHHFTKPLDLHLLRRLLAEMPPPSRPSR